MIADPPFEDGTVQVTTDCVLAFEVAETEVGASGVVAGVPEVEVDAAPATVEYARI